MAICSRCGEDNPARARFCLGCGASLAADSGRREVRKTVTVVFSDLVGSTPLGERLDPESLREVITRYYDRAAEVLTRHGGTVAKFIGDAVMAVYGIPSLHEDDALRAVRGASELGGALAELNAELQATLGVRLALRTGVNTGEVVVGNVVHGQDVVVGDAVNVAARLEQAAGPGEVLIGERTWRLVRDAVTVEPVASLALKGKGEPVAGFRLLSVRPDMAGHARHLDAPMVGRGTELTLLGGAMEQAVGGRSCVLAVVLGAAGMGKSRLVQEFLSHLGSRQHVPSSKAVGGAAHGGESPVAEDHGGDAHDPQEVDVAVPAGRRGIEEPAQPATAAHPGTRSSAGLPWCWRQELKETPAVNRSAIRWQPAPARPRRVTWQWACRSRANMASSCRRASAVWYCPVACA
jgi:class 3 adenylate cyclase